jgi:coenzyme F420 hydrogenase subunit beta
MLLQETIKSCIRESYEYIMPSLTHAFCDIDPSLCTLCGTCVGICPHGTLAIQGDAVSFVSECRRCGLCHSLCPGQEVDFGILTKKYLGTTECDRYFGYFREMCQGYATDVNIRKNGSSGGVVTALLIDLLEAGIINGAVVVGTSRINPLQPEVQIARTRESIIQSSQSKYGLVSVNTILRQLKNEDGIFAFVGLPCHIHGLRKLQLANRPESQKIGLMIGLYCGFNMHSGGTEFLLRKLGIDKIEVIELKYRAGISRGLFVKTKDREFSIGKHIYNIICPLFLPQRCLFCTDLTNELADLSVGDLWITTDDNGWSSVILRSAYGKKLYQEAIRRKHIFSVPLLYETLFHSHKHLLFYKKDLAISRLAFYKAGPKYTSQTQNQTIVTKILGLFSLFLFVMLGSRPIKILFAFIPMRLIEGFARLPEAIIRKK